MRKIIDIGFPTRVPENRLANEAMTAFAKQHRMPIDSTLCLHFQDSDPKLAELLALLKSYGFSLRPPERARDLRPEDIFMFVRHQVRFEFEPVDWEAAEYLVPEPITTYTGVDDFSLGEDRLLMFSFRGRVPKVWRSVDITCDWNHRRYMVSDRAREAIEAAGLKHVVFRPVHRHEYYEKRGAPILWELFSDLVLPPMSRTVPFRDMQGRMRDPNDPEPVTRQPYPIDGMWAYERSALRSVGEFDVARTFEPNQGPNVAPWRETSLVVSSAFYRLFRDNDFKCSWTPVKIIEDEPYS